MRLSYEQKLQLPQWREFRELVLEVRGRECEHCGNPDGPLQIHHCGYVAGREPWEYEITEVKVLCHACHELLHERKKAILNFLDDADIVTLTVVLEAFAEFMKVEEKCQAVVAERIYCLMREEHRRVTRERLERLDAEELKGRRRALGNFLLRLDPGRLDPLLDAIDILDSFSEAERYRTAGNIVQFLQAWSPPEVPPELRPIIPPAKRTASIRSSLRRPTAVLDTKLPVAPALLKSRSLSKMRRWLAGYPI